ncbi:MAG: glucose-6-phosphate isomerase [Anaerovoracaceae bacterium]
MDIKIDTLGARINPLEIQEEKTNIENALESIWADKEGMTGWVKLPLYQDKTLIEEILVTADEIRDKANLVIVIGIGGSSLGAKAAIEALSLESGSPKVIFAGNSFSAKEQLTILNKVRDKEVCLCVISKNGMTAETMAAYGVFKGALKKKYEREGIQDRVYIVTDPSEGDLRKEAIEEGYTSFSIPERIGGRYSALTPAGLLPMAIAGIDIRSLLRGAEVMASSPTWDFQATDYAACRYLFWKKGKTLELIQYKDPALEPFVQWVRQLFAESEGKQGKGLFPVDMRMVTEMHSMGQFLQEGSQIFFETLISVEEDGQELVITEGPLAGKTYNELNRIGEATIGKVHEEALIPVIKITIPELTPFYYGQLIYFLQTTCAITGKLMGVDPFDQPGVEIYKKAIKKAIL